MMNWPTAFVIAVAICAGAFLYNKPSDAAFGGSERRVVPVAQYEAWVQIEGSKKRICAWGEIQSFYEFPSVRAGEPSQIVCLPWKTD